MLFLRFSPGAAFLRLCRPQNRVNPLPQALARSLSTLSSQPRPTAQQLERTSPTSSSRFVRGVTARPASRPKAHTGRKADSPRPKKAISPRPKKAVASSASNIPEGTAGATSAVEAKPKAVKRVKKRKTAEQKAELEKKKHNKLIRELRLEALSPPKNLPESAFLVISTELSRGSSGLATKQASEKYKNLNMDELQHYNSIANQNKASNKDAYEAWVREIPADQVLRANNARNRLSRLGIKGYARHVKDPRQVKRACQPMTFFVKSRYQTGEMHGISPQDGLRQLAQQWKELSASEKEPFLEQAVADRARYEAEFERVYGYPVPPSASAAAASAA